MICDLQGTVVPDYVISPFQFAIDLTDLEPCLVEQFFEQLIDLEAKSLFTRSRYCNLCSKEMVAMRHASSLTLF